MKPSRIALAALAAVAAVATACSTLEVSTDFDPATDFGRYRTFVVREGGRSKDPIAEDRVLSSLVTTLESKGLQRVDSRADLKVFVHYKTGTEKVVHTSGYSGWYGWRWGGGTSTRTVERIPVGTVVIDLVDTRTDRAVWRGLAKDRIVTDGTPEERTKAVNEAMAELFAGFPPKKAP